MARLSLFCLGAFHVTRDGQSLSGFESGKARALLAYLAVEADRPHSRHALAGLLWPNRPDRAAHNDLRQALANLRQVIGDRAAASPFLLVTRDTIQFNPASDHCLDAADFGALLATCETHAHRNPKTCRSCAGRLKQAADLYRGDFLAQFFLSDGEAFEEWALIQRERLRRLALDALYRLADYHERRGEYSQALDYATRQLALDAWREEAHRQVMRALASSGQRSAALAQYETCRRVLAAELGVAPAPDTTALHERIKLSALKPEAFTPAHNLPTPIAPRQIRRSR
jgi:DNA-binding SARP family transcriptional activator